MPQVGELPERFGRYRILKCLGQGGMGSVYLAEDTQLERKVALKVAHLGSADDPETIARFRREARAAAALDHPNLCAIYDSGTIDDEYYLTMALIEGESLADWLTSRQIFPDREAAGLVAKLAAALSEAHAKGVIHRDLKPSNVMMKRVGGNREPVIVDFGLARRDHPNEEKLTKTGQFLGTLHYMSPEQLKGSSNEHSPSCDIYALGVILYELLTGQTPFNGPAPLLIARILMEEAPPPSTIRLDIDPSLEAVCLKAIVKDATKRYASMESFAKALETAMETDSSPFTWTSPTTGMEFVQIPAGTFKMGSNKVDDKDAADNEMHRHRVRITKPFFLGKYQVTRGQFRKFAEGTDYKETAWQNPGFAQTDEHPVVNVSWYDVNRYCEWLSRKEGRIYRLPTEAEWEYACRADSTTRYSFGDDAERLPLYGNVADGTAKEKYPDWDFAMSAKDGYIYTAPVGQFLPNTWDLYDMHGNVREWCSDNYSTYRGAQVDPQGSSDMYAWDEVAHIAHIPHGVVRGGGWKLNPLVCRSACRTDIPRSERSSDLGFRLVSVPPPAPLVVRTPILWTSPSIGMQFVLIPAGGFFMGSEGDSDMGQWRDEKPCHRVRITKPFFMGIYKVTIGEFRKFVEDSDYKTEAERDGKGGTGWNEEKKRLEGHRGFVEPDDGESDCNEQKKEIEEQVRYTWMFTGLEQTDEHPVVNISWNNSAKFCEWLSKKDGRIYRLPTEAEWEYACSAGITPYSGDDNEVDMYTSHVGEWCADWYTADYYGVSPENDPQGPSDGAVERVVRGRCSPDDWYCCSTTHREGEKPDDRSLDLGFRVAAVYSEQ